MDEQLAFVKEALARKRAYRERASFPQARACAEEDLEVRWHQYFCDLNAVPPGSLFSLTDMVFVTLCHGLQGEEVSMQTIGVCFAELAIYSSQHSLASRVRWPAADEWAAFKRVLASVVVTYFDSGPRSREELLRLFQTFTFDPFPSAGEFAHCHEPDELLAERAKRKLQAERDKAQGKDVSERDEVSEEAAGLLWRNSAEELLDNFVRLASRVVFAIDRDNRFVAAWPQSAPVQFTKQPYLRLHRWVVDKCRVEQTDSLTKLVRDTANTWFLPLGAETNRSRDAATATDTEDPQQMLMNELGLDLGSHLHDRSLGKLAGLAADPGGLFWDALLLSLLHTVLDQRRRFLFIQDYVFWCPHGHTARFAADHFRGADKRPVLLHAQRAWWVLHQGSLRRCTGLAHAVLCWMWIVRQEFACELENTEDVREIIEWFLTDESVVG